MARDSRSLLKVLGTIFLVAAMACAVGAAVVAKRAEPVFQAQTLFKLNNPADGARLPEAFRQAQAKLPERIRRPLTERVSLEPGPALDYYRITARAPSPLASAEVANNLTLLLRDHLSGTPDAAPLMLLERAEAPAGPTRVHAKEILKRGLILGGACGAAGALLLAAAGGRRKPPAPAE